ncbi:MAG TPA: translation elongation factor Ts [Bacteroidia bacterium]|jgi:elongation factor Ts|nr:translation elongation factor Ts [Bacteroidia bacterium]
MTSATMNITAADVNKLRQQTGAGMMDCKKALTEANGDFEKAIDILREKGQKVAANRSDRDAKEGVVIAKVSADGKKGTITVLNCETDFVARNADFIKFVDTIGNIALNGNFASVTELKAAIFADGLTIEQKITEYVGKIGEKMELRYEKVTGEKVFAYNHPGNKLASIVGFNKADTTAEVGKEISMQIAAMAPIAIDKSDVTQETLDREMAIAKEQARQEGKPENMLEKIAIGKVNKFYKESTLLNQDFIKDSKKTVQQFLQDNDKELKVTGFKRIVLG